MRLPVDRPRPHIRLPVPPRQVTDAVVRACRVLRLSQSALAKRAGTSVRTVQRWRAGTSFPTRAQMAMLAQLVHPVQPELASQVAVASGTSLLALGLAPPPDPAAPAALPPAHRIERVVYAAAEASDLSPRAVRPALVAAFTRAKEVGFTLDDVLAALSAAK
jgi:transcriptional regulator with XRE-family HTH domain